MAQFPTSIISYPTNPAGTDATSATLSGGFTHSGFHGSNNDELEAMQAKIGVDGSAVVTSHDYMLATAWVDISSKTFSRTDDDTFTVTGEDVTTTLTKGARLKWTDSGGTKYGTVISSTFSTNTTVNIMTNTDYVIASDPTAMAYSYAAIPQGYPDWFTVAAPTWDVSTFDDGAGGQPTTDQYHARLIGRTCDAEWIGTGTKATTDDQLKVTTTGLPAFATVENHAGNAWVLHGGKNYAGVVVGGGSLWCYFDDNITDNTTISGAAWRISFEI